MNSKKFLTFSKLSSVQVNASAAADVRDCIYYTLQKISKEYITFAKTKEELSLA